MIIHLKLSYEIILSYDYPFRIKLWDLRISWIKHNWSRFHLSGTNVRIERWAFDSQWIKLVSPLMTYCVPWLNLLTWCRAEVWRPPKRQNHLFCCDKSTYLIKDTIIQIEWAHACIKCSHKNYKENYDQAFISFESLDTSLPLVDNIPIWDFMANYLIN